MKLKDLLRELPDNELIAIGAKSSFVWIGRVSEIPDDCFYLYMQDIQNKLSNVKETVALLDVRKSKTKRNATVLKNKLQSKIEKYQNYLDNYIPAKEREVKSIVERNCLNHEVVCVVEGTEAGSYWFLHECKEDTGSSNITNLPLIEPERKIGKWIITKDKGDVYAHMRCSNCGQYWSDPSMIRILTFCPSCGTKMEASVAGSCIHCGSTRFVKNGKMNGVQRYKCKDCKKDFYEK